MLLLLMGCWAEFSCGAGESVTETAITFTRHDGAIDTIVEADEYPDGPAFYNGDGTPDHGIIVVSEELGGDWINIATHFNGAGVGDTCKDWNHEGSTGACGWFEVSADVVNEDGDQLFDGGGLDHDDGTMCIVDLREDSEGYYLSFAIESSFSYGDASLEMVGTVLDAFTAK